MSYSTLNTPFKVTLIPASSRVSLKAAFSNYSPGSTLPPGNHHPLFFVSKTAKY